MSRPPSHARQGFTLIELLVVISIIAILAGLLLPAVTMVKDNANRTADSNNLKQIMIAIVAYQGQEESIPIGNIAAGAITTPANAAISQQIAYRSFEVLGDVMQLPNAIWKSRNHQGDTAPKARANRANTTTTWSSSGLISWAYDWCAPGECASFRIMLAARNPKWYKQKATMAVAADSSTRTLKVTALTGAGGVTTAGIPSAYIVPNSDAIGDDNEPPLDATKPDNIYDGVSDGTATPDLTTGLPNEGSSRRAWVK